MIDLSKVREAIGPVTSSWGMKTWRLLLFDDEIVAWPYSFREGLRLGVPFLVARPAVVPPASLVRSAEADGFRKVHRYRMAEVADVILRSKMARNAIEIRGVDGAVASYGIWDREETDSYGEVLRKMYREKFRKADFPKTFFDRIRKY